MIGCPVHNFTTMDEDKRKNIVNVLDFLKVVLLALISYFSATACGATKAVIKTNADNTQSTITITTNNPTSVTASPNVDFQYKPID